MSILRTHLRKRHAELHEVFQKLPSHDLYYPTLLSPSRANVRLQLRGQSSSKDFINFASSNYLNLNARSEVREAHQEAFDVFGSGSNGSPVLSGYYEPHRQLESSLRRLHDCSGVVLFSSGYCANLSVMSACLGPSDLVVFDESIHGSVIDGARLSGAKMRSFAHNDPDDLRRVLQRFRADAENVMFATCGIFSMSGEIAPLPELLTCAREYDTLTLLDDAHAVGVLGASGRGTLEHYGLPPTSVDFCVGTLSKTLAGMGGYVATSEDVAEFLRFGARPHILSASIPPTAAAGCRAAVEILEQEGAELSAALRSKAQGFRDSLRSKGIDLLGDGTGVAAFSVPDFEQLWRATQFLFERRVFLNPVLYPAVRKDEGRLRFYLNLHHDPDGLERVAEAVFEAMEVSSATGHA